MYEKRLPMMFQCQCSPTEGTFFNQKDSWARSMNKSSRKKSSLNTYDTDLAEEAKNSNHVHIKVLSSSEKDLLQNRATSGTIPNMVWSSLYNGKSPDQRIKMSSEGL